MKRERRNSNSNLVRLFVEIVYSIELCYDRLVRYLKRELQFIYVNS